MDIDLFSKCGLSGVLFFVCFFFQLLEGYMNVVMLILLWSARNILWTAKLPLTFHQHGGK